MRQFGIYEKGRFQSRIDGILTKEYAIWDNMIKRTHPGKIWIKHPRYAGCSCSENFLRFQWFADWCQTQIGFYPDAQLDKDLLYKGNKVYSENTCVFIPRELNNLLISCNSMRGDLPIGVCYNKKSGKYQAQVSDMVDGDNIYLGLFNDPLSAFSAYKQEKEKLIRRKAEKYREAIDQRAYEALIKYEVCLND